eukprot:gene640-1074_t
MDSKLFEYTLNKVKTARVEMEPFPHVFIRGAGNFNDATAKVLDTQFWADFTNLYASPALGQQWVETLGATTAQRYNRTGDDWNITFSYRMDLSRDLSGYGIGPHTDTDFKWSAQRQSTPF